MNIFFSKKQLIFSEHCSGPLAMLQALSGATAEQVSTKETWAEYTKKKTAGLTRTEHAHMLECWDLCNDIDALFVRLGGLHVRDAFIYEYAGIYGQRVGSQSLRYALSQFIVGWYGLYKTSLMEPAEKRTMVAAIQGGRFARVRATNLKQQIVKALDLPARLARGMDFNAPDTGYARSSASDFHDAGIGARRKKRPLEDDAPMSEAQRRVIELPELPMEMWEMIGERITDWQTLGAFSLTCRRFNRIATRTVKSPGGERTWHAVQGSRLCIAWHINDAQAAVALQRAYELVGYQVDGYGPKDRDASTEEARALIRRDVCSFPGQFAMACHWLNMMWAPCSTALLYELSSLRGECERFYTEFGRKLGAGYLSRGTLFLALAHVGYLVITAERGAPLHCIEARMKMRVVRITDDTIPFAPPTTLAIDST